MHQETPDGSKPRYPRSKILRATAGTAQSYNSTGITVDTTDTCSKPTSLDLASNDDTGASNSDNITKITDDSDDYWLCAEANSTVEIFKDDASFSTPVTDTADTTHASCAGGTKRFSANIDLSAAECDRV